LTDKEKEIREKKIDEKSKLVIQHVRKNSAIGKFTIYSDLLENPVNLEEAELDEVMQTLKTSEKYEDLKELDGKKNKYLYSGLEMTDNYAKMLFKIEEKDLLSLVADTVRYDSKKYPRTTNTKEFFSHPFGFTRDEINNILKQLNSREEYKDIKESRASNGAIHIYSDLYLTQDYANALTEWIEVSMNEAQ